MHLRDIFLTACLWQFQSMCKMFVFTAKKKYRKIEMETHRESKKIENTKSEFQ